MACLLQRLQAMLGSRGVKLGGLFVLVVVGGCWSETLEDGVFSPDQWAMLQDSLEPLGPLAPCPKALDRDDHCDSLAAFGRTLFFDKKLSETHCPTRTNPLGLVRPSTCTQRPGIVSCASCHDPKNWFIDTREPNAVSQGETAPTKRNSIGLVDAALKEVQAPDQPVFTWIGSYSTAGDVLDLAINKAMSSTVADLAQTIRESHGPDFEATWGTVATTTSDDEIFHDVALSFEAYIRRLTSSASPFERYRAGDESAISDSAKRGFAVFVGPGGCLECHSGPLFSDLQPRSTGVPQLGVADAGRNNTGTFVTPSLRNVAMTPPYMHDGVFASLGEVIEFYRRGGDQSGFPKDPRLVPLDITDADAHDLEAFLGTLTGGPVSIARACGEPSLCP
jgi:cytochrome c peroxidase